MANEIWSLSGRRALGGWGNLARWWMEETRVEDTKMPITKTSRLNPLAGWLSLIEGQSKDLEWRKIQISSIHSWFLQEDMGGYL